MNYQKREQAHSFGPFWVFFGGEGEVAGSCLQKGDIWVCSILSCGLAGPPAKMKTLILAIFCEGP